MNKIDCYRHLLMLDISIHKLRILVWMADGRKKGEKSFTAQGLSAYWNISKQHAFKAFSENCGRETDIVKQLPKVSNLPKEYTITSHGVGLLEQILNVTSQTNNESENIASL